MTYSFDNAQCPCVYNKLHAQCLHSESKSPPYNQPWLIHYQSTQMDMYYKHHQLLRTYVL